MTPLAWFLNVVTVLYFDGWFGVVLLCLGLQLLVGEPQANIPADKIQATCVEAYIECLSGCYA